MNGPRIALVALILMCGTAVSADDAAIKKTVKAKAEEMNAAFIKDDFEKVAALTHPKMVELAGGLEKCIAAMKMTIQDLKAKGYVARSVSIDEPSDPVLVGSVLYIVSPFQLEMTAPNGKLRLKSFSIGVSNDGGTTWGFLNGDLDVKTIKAVLPDLPEQLKLPTRQKPVFEKE